MAFIASEYPFPFNNSLIIEAYSELCGIKSSVAFTASINSQHYIHFE